MNIGLTQRIIYHKNRAYDCVEHGWYSLLKDHTLYFIPNIPTQDFDLLSSNLDLLIITGGDDSPLRRLTEIKILTKMFSKNKPVLGICHGAFLLTDVLGGTVEETTKNHIDTEHIIHSENQNILVNSFHNLVITRCPQGATSISTDLEGFCESWIYKKISAIVWHPERMETPYIPDSIKQITGL